MRTLTGTVGNDSSVDLGPEFAALPRSERERAYAMIGTEVGDRRGGRVCVMIRRDTGEIGSVTLAEARKGILTPTLTEDVMDWHKRPEFLGG